MYGLVLAGGHSSRMGYDKSLLQINNKLSYQNATGLLSQHCSRVFISCRNDQNLHFNHPDLIYDNYENCGPIAGVLTAMESYREQDWLVMAVDMLFTSSEMLDYLMKHYSPGMSVFYSTPKNIEPLLGIYAAPIYPQLKNAYSAGLYSLNQILKNTNDVHLLQTNDKILMSVNTPEELEEFLRKSKI